MGNWGTVLARFDLYPSLFVLSSLVLAEKKKFAWAYFSLGLATALKVYPIFLFLPLFIYEQFSHQKLYPFWQRMKGALVFISMILVIFGGFFIFAGDQVLKNLYYTSHLPTEVESTLAVTYAAISGIFQQPLCIFVDNGAISISLEGCASTFVLASILPAVFSLFLLASYVWLIYQQIRQRIPLDQMFLVVLLSVLVWNRTFSPQYLLWVTPILVYTIRSMYKILVWATICVITSLYLFNFGLSEFNHFPNTTWNLILLRDLIFLGFTYWLIFRITHLAKVKPQTF